MSIAQQRQAAVGDTIESIRNIVGKGGVTRASLADVLTHVEDLAAHTELWSEADYPPLEPGERQARYLIAEDPDQTYALYLNVMRPGKRIPPHNHTTWACVAGVSGVEFNDVYTRTDDGSQPGVGTLEHSRTVEVGPRHGIALLPDDIHSVEIRGEDYPPPAYVRPRAGNVDRPADVRPRNRALPDHERGRTDPPVTTTA